MTAGLLIAFFLFVVAAVTAAGYIFVFRSSREENAGANSGATLALSQPDLPPAQSAIADIFQTIGQTIGESLPGAGQQEELRTQLMAAGYRWPSASSIFLGIKVAASVLLVVLLTWASLAGRSDPGVAFIAAVCGLGLGFMVPDRVLDRLAKRRVNELRRSLPAALDLLLLAIEAGQGLDAAIADTSRGLRTTHPALASEFTQLQLELKANTSRTDALRNFANRCRDAELRKFANLLIDTDRFGTSLGPALRTHARYLRIRFRQNAQERARKVGVKLIFPVFFLIFPSVILVTLGPAVILLMTQMKNLLAL
jgi:tight adherence protein C